MAIANAARTVMADDGTIYEFEDGRLFDAIVAATERALAPLDDAALLGQRQARIVAKTKRAVRDELDRAMPERLAARSPWHFSRALGALITRETRKRQFAAFERRLNEQYGPVEPLTHDEFFEHAVKVNGVWVIPIEPPTERAEAESAG